MLIELGCPHGQGFLFGRPGRLDAIDQSVPVDTLSGIGL
jgi:EAL domain-containing protein (putative c-di-GMP-specific phosphodiesterase class I)